MTNLDFATQRERMVTEQIQARDIKQPAVLHAMRTVPRERFVPEEYHAYAYQDTPLPIPANQTISQPFVVAFMIAALNLAPTDTVLEIGTGSGYAAALLSRMVATVHTVERHQVLVDYAQGNLAALGYGNVHVHLGDGTLGWPDAAPYNGIIVAASGPRVPPSLTKQLALHGRLVMPIGKRGKQRLVLLLRQDEANYRRTSLGPVKFVPLIGAEGWQRGE